MMRVIEYLFESVRYSLKYIIGITLLFFAFFLSVKLGLPLVVSIILLGLYTIGCIFAVAGLTRRMVITTYRRWGVARMTYSAYFCINQICRESGIQLCDVKLDSDMVKANYRIERMYRRSVWFGAFAITLNIAIAVAAMTLPEFSLSLFAAIAICGSSGLNLLTLWDAKVKVAILTNLNKRIKNAHPNNQ